MSIEALTYAFKLEGLSPTKKLVLVVLANYADEKGSCYPSYQHIGRLAGIKDPKHIGKIIKEFAQQDLLEITARFKEDGGNISNRYTLQLGQGLQTPTGEQTSTPHGQETTTPPVSPPPNTKEDTKDNTKELFEEFWKIYPRKTNKYAASQKYKIALRDISHEGLIKKIKSYAEFVADEKMELKFVPHCTTWLNQKRYLDDTDTTVTKVKKSLNSIAG